MAVPEEPKIYHIVHIDRLSSIVAEGCLWSDAEASSRNLAGTTIGMAHIKDRRRAKSLQSRPCLRVGDCVPFYFCPRSVMLYVLYRSDHSDLAYAGGQNSVVHMEADLRRAVDWAGVNGLRWAFTTTNAGSGFFEDYADLSKLDRINWSAVEAVNWASPDSKEGKQAEFLFESAFPWELITLVGVHSLPVRDRVRQILAGASHQPAVSVTPAWYY